MVVLAARHRREERVRRARVEIQEAKKAVGLFRLVGRPFGKTVPPPEASEPSLGIDPWGRPYLYEERDDRSFVVRTLEADGVDGGDGEDADLSTDDPEEGR